MNGEWIMHKTEAARRIGCSRFQVARLIACGEIRTRRLPGDVGYEQLYAPDVERVARQWAKQSELAGAAS